MEPAGLQTSSFAGYPPLARGTAAADVALLRQVPLPLLPILLREISALDWKFPRERQDIEAQLQWLRDMTEATFVATVQPFRALTLPASLRDLDWVNDAPGYMEQLTAALWATHQMPAFREAAKVYAERFAAVRRTPVMLPGLSVAQEGTAPQAATGQVATGQVAMGQATYVRDESGGVAKGRGAMEQGAMEQGRTGQDGRSSSGRGSVVDVPHEAQVGHVPAMPRLVMIVLAASLGEPAPGVVPYRSLRRGGVLLDQLDPLGGFATLQARLYERARRVPAAYAHWHIDGAAPAAMPLGPGARITPPQGLAGASETDVVFIGYDTLAPTRERLLARAGRVMNAGTSGPEELRTLMAHLSPDAAGLPAMRDRVLAHFELSLLTEGSGTQIFSTTFVQWASRECLRRAQPATLLARYTPRQREQGMNDLLSGAPSAGVDAEGSRVDAEQAAWYTWLNLQRLPDAAQSRFLVWQEGTSTAVVLGPGLPRGTTSTSPMTMPQVLRLLA